MQTGFLQPEDLQKSMQNFFCEECSGVEYARYQINIIVWFGRHGWMNGCMNVLKTQYKIE